VKDRKDGRYIRERIGMGWIVGVNGIEIKKGGYWIETRKTKEREKVRLRRIGRVESCRKGKG